MAVDLAGAQDIKLDIGPAVAGLNRLSDAADATAASIKQGQAQMSAGFAEVARAATAYSDKLAAQQAEQRAATAAVQSAREALKQLTDQQKELTAAQGKTNSTTAEYQRLQKLLEQNRVEIQKAKQAITENREAVLQEKAAVDQVREARRQEVNATREAAAATKDAAKAANEEAAAEKEVAAAAKQAGSASAAASSEASTGTGFFGGLLSKASGLFAGLFAVGKLKQVGEEIIEVTSEFERMAAVLTTINGGDADKGKLEFAALRQFTLRNPFEVREVTESYVQLRNRGLNPTIDQLQSLGDLAAASGLDIGRASEALLGATTGQYRMLKAFGVTAKQEGDNVAFTFHGVTTVVQKSQEAIAAYVLGLGELNGVAGATERIMATTGGRITNLKDSFTELFAAIGEGTGGPLNFFIARLTKFISLRAEALKTPEQKALDQVVKTGAAQDFGGVADGLFSAAKKQAATNGTDEAFGLGAVNSQLSNTLAKQLAEAERAVSLVETAKKKAREGIASLFPTAEEKAQNLAARDLDDKQETAARYRVVLIKAEQSALAERYKVAREGNKEEENSLGLLAAARAKLAVDEKTREENKDITKKHELNQLILADQKVIDDLLEKQEKARKGRTYSYEAQLRALLQERETLTTLAGKASEQMADDAAARARAVFDEGLRQVEVVRQKLIQRELDLRKAAAKVGGSAVARLGDKADGVVDGVQDAQLARLRVLALDKYYAELGKIEIAREQRLFDLRADSDAKEVEQIDRKYEKLIEAAKDNIEKQALAEAQAREQVALRAQQEQRRIDQTAKLATATAQAVGQNFGAGTGISVFEAKRAEQQALLNIEKKAAEDSLSNTLNKVGKEAEIERAALRAQLARIGQQQKDLDREQLLSKFSIYKLILGENDNEKTRAALDNVTSQVVSAIGQTLEAEQQAAAQRVQIANQNIQTLSAQLAAEISLRNAGSASNIAGLRQQIQDEKAARREALDQQRTAAKEKVLLDTLTQVSSLITASAEIFAAFAPIPVIGIPLALGAIAFMTGAFAAAKISAYQQAGNIGQGYFKGGPTGGQSIHEERGVVHGKEFVFDNEKTSKYEKALFLPLHEGKPENIDWQHASLAGISAFMPDFELPARLREEKRLHVEHTTKVSVEPLMNGLGSRFDAMHDRLAAIESSNQTMAEQPTVVSVGNGYLIRWPNGSTKLVGVKE